MLLYKCKRGQRTWPAAEAGGGRGPADTKRSYPGDTGLDPELGRPRGHAKCCLPLVGGTVSSAQQGERNNPEPAPWLQRSSEALARESPVTNTGHPSQPCPCRGCTGAAPSSCPARNVGPSLGEGRRRKQGGTALIQIPDHPPCVDFIPSLLLQGSSLAPRGAPEGCRQPSQGSLSAATSPHQAFRDKKTRFYSCGRHRSTSPAGNASAGWCAGRSPRSLVLVPGGRTGCPRYPLLIPAAPYVCPSTHRRQPLLLEPRSGGAPSTPGTQVPAFAVAKEENATATEQLTCLRVPTAPHGQVSGSSFSPRPVPRCCRAGTHGLSPPAVPRPGPFLWLFQLFTHPLLRAHFPTS